MLPFACMVNKKYKVKQQINKNRQLLIIDEKPVRRKAINKCKYILKQFDKVTAEIEKYEQKDLPAFKSWMYRTFGLTLTNIRELCEEQQKIEDLINTIKFLIYYMDLSPNEAYQKAMELTENPEKIYEWFRQNKDEQDDYYTWADNNGSRQEDHEYRNTENENQHDRREYQEYSKTEENCPENIEKTLDETRLKDTYRQLAHKLHPDASINNNPRKYELWYRVQEAYQAGSVEELETLWATYDIRETRNYKNTPVSQILAIHENYKDDLRILRRKNRRYNKEKGWDFTNKTRRQLNTLKEKIKESLVYEKEELEWNLKWLNNLLNSYAEPPEEQTEDETSKLHVNTVYTLNAKPKRNKEPKEENEPDDQLEFDFL